MAAETFADAPEGMRKTCPRETFLGLCQAGLLRGVPAGACKPVESRLNRLYAVAAVRLLMADPLLVDGSKTELWRRAMKVSGGDPNKKHNQQLDVVLSLWRNQLIDTSAARLPELPPLP